MLQSRRSTGRRSIYVFVIAAVTSLIGAVLGVGGGWLAALGGSWYYLIAGISLVISGVLFFMHRRSGVFLYAVIIAATAVWALAEAGLDGWALVPRLIAPLILFAFVIACLPCLYPQTSWRHTISGLSSLVVLSCVGGFFVYELAPDPAANPLPVVTARAMADPSTLQAGVDWPAYGGSDSARRFSPLAEITPDNVKHLKRAWVAHTGDLPSEQAKGTYGAETTPLKVGDSLYLCTPKNIMLALDPATGKEKWRYDPHVPDESIPYTAACRGVAFFEQPDAKPSDICAERVIEGTLDARLIAVDAKTGEPCPNFGRAGTVDTTDGIGQHDPGMFSMTSAPTIVRGIIVVGHQVLDGQKLDAPSGVVQAYDAVSGALRWTWDMERPDNSGLPPEHETYSRGTPNMWTTASGDEQLGLVYLPLGSAAVDYWSSARSALEKQFSTSLVAIDVMTGKSAWHFQTVHNDVWDYDLGSQATLLDYPTDAGPVPALVLPSKRGDIFVLDRRTGKPLFPVEERAVPRGGVEPDQRAPTQPFSTYHSLRKPDLTEANMWGMSPIDQMICRIEFRLASYDGIFTPPTSDRHSIEYPGYNGGSDWGGIATDPQRGVLIANYNDMPNYNRLIPRAEADQLGWAPRDQARGKIGGAEGAGDPQAGAPYAINVNAGWRLPVTGLLCKEPPYGGIRAIDLKTGKMLWDRPLGEARTNGPFGIPSMLPVTIGTPNNGGAVVTAGGLIFIAAATDNLIRAIDIKTGQTLWTDVLPAGGQATPMTYEINGKQYLVIMAGGHHFMETPVGDAVIAYALP
ncbi:membrane-bound PQQ-dependent dehydrogenase, glucose/quinate/shikimate family [Rhizobium leguminosarum]|uniref:Membrane-bound PQQ-dependent dehydrogenase, glucose/quinate/shikimate family n=1 Tax=Rhizobium leguminosarum TaxID=384 RepID=A0A4Q8XRW0_RHILE|nr:membrane-bound PQQ-dependent dehydrogenase, glucose/quinate/shikimate family [Rhizobium leguminosarum]TAX22736.1 membrane-bound PQQ-dependent dehydrogenase, glucose/quinate/shikimate family [Rhizobium leguminosarum]TAX43380.1 membrane-bound PQQ-dependent dehydrogenase, glucose/quinate/shikimate family [Rhizobium leguminosarum]TAX46535.1 membrane-bound PQQ-dependent dehydrogenase, glucose/quinate/shikimate family [Rhizobium leguminosarum]TAX64434.1 membrane-bound PQQ-dependent dehydrogenase, 